MRLKSIECLRGIAILAVVGVHVFSNGGQVRTPGPLLQTTVFLKLVLEALAVPLFIFISGYVLAKRYWDGFSAKEFYGKRLSAILLPYIAFSLFYTLAFGLQDGWPSLGETVRRLLTGEAADHLWFFGVIFGLYLVYPLLVALCRKNLPVVLALSLAVQASIKFCYASHSVPHAL